MRIMATGRKHTDEVIDLMSKNRRITLFTIKNIPLRQRFKTIASNSGEATS